jgi:hypothetical protein
MKTGVWPPSSSPAPGLLLGLLLHPSHRRPRRAPPPPGCPSPAERPLVTPLNSPTICPMGGHLVRVEATVAATCAASLAGRVFKSGACYAPYHIPSGSRSSWCRTASRRRLRGDLQAPLRCWPAPATAWARPEQADRAAHRGHRRVDQVLGLLAQLDGVQRRSVVPAAGSEPLRERDRLNRCRCTRAALPPIEEVHRLAGDGFACPAHWI